VEVLEANKIKVSVSVKNTGKRKGEEVVQLYIRDVVASLVRPVKELKGFEKISLEAKEQKKLEFLLTEKELGFFNNEGKFVFEKGKFEIMIGGNSKEVLKKEVKID